MATKEQAMSDNSIVTVSEFRDIVHKHVDDSELLTETWITGTAAVMVEIKDVVDTEFLKIEIFAIVLIILLLFFVLKSYLTPIRSVVTIFMSVIWTVAITHLLFDKVLGVGVLWILPIMLIVICLGLGMDYDILLTTRIREYRFAKGMSNDEAISQAVLHSGSVITICGFIMAGTFGTMMLSSTVMLQQMGFALAFAILVDALIVRTYIVPAAMHLMGEWNWKGPAILKGTHKAERGTAAIFGALGALVMIACTIVAFAMTGEAFGTVDIDMLMDYDSTTEMLTKVGFGLGGALTVGFGAFMLYTNRNAVAKVSGILYAAAGALMMVASLAAIQDVSSDTMWYAAFVVAGAASLVYAYYASTGKHGMSAGLMFMALIAFGGAVVAGALTYTFGLALAAMVSILFASLCESVEIQ